MYMLATTPPVDSDWLLATHPVHRCREAHGHVYQVIMTAVWRNDVKAHTMPIKTCFSQQNIIKKQLEVAKQNPDACDCVWIDGRLN